jgi:transmembrane sensor
MSAHHQDRTRELIAEQAAQWLCDLREGSDAERAAFFKWLRQSPLHVEEFLLASSIWNEMAHVGPRSADELEDLVKAAMAASIDSQVITLRSGTSLAAAHVAPDSGTDHIRRRRARAIGIAASILLLAGSIAAWWGSSPTRSERGEIYGTQVGEQRAVRLADGSVIHLNTQSRVEVNLAEHARDVTLAEGEAFFIVERDADRPFRVHSGHAVVQALGTQFNVLRRGESTTVSVIEGTVQVSTDAVDIASSASATATASGLERPSSATVRAGQQARVAAGSVDTRSDPEIASSVVWRERRLVFRGEPLEDIAAEFNRYTPRHIRVEGEIARGKRLAGTFSADDPESLILFLSRYPDLVVERTDAEIIVRER